MKYKLLTGAVVILCSTLMAFLEIPNWGWVLAVGAIIMLAEENDDDEK